MNRAYSITDILKMKKKIFEFKNEWKDAFGTPGATGVWFIYGRSTSGKSRFIMQLAKYLSKFGNVIYDPLEEEYEKTLQDSIIAENMQEVAGRVKFFHESIFDLSDRLLKRHSPDIAIIDSFQYTGLNYKQYKELKEKHRNKLIIFSSHVEGKNPAGQAANRVMSDASLKIWVEGYKAFSKGRYIGETGEFIIWDDGAKKYWGKF